MKAMKKFQILGVALVAVFAFGAVIAASASAEVVFLLAEWLINNADVVGELEVLAGGELTLTDNKVPILGEASVLCSGFLHGFILPNGEDSITELLSLTDVAINLTGLVENGLDCVNILNCPTPLVWAVNLPWLTLLELMEDPPPTSFFVVLISSSGVGNPGWEVSCMGNGTSDTCTANTEAVFEVKNGATITEALFSLAITELAGLLLATCTLGGAESGDVETDTGTVGTITPDSGTLTVSSTG